MPEHVLVTGGYGFIGLSIVYSLIQCGNRVRVLDSLIEQVHGDRDYPRKFSEDVELIVVDILDSDTVRAAIKGVDRSEEHKSELQSLLPISYAVFCLKQK